MQKRTVLSAAISGILFGTTMALSGAVFAQDADAQGEEELLVEEVVVTGSRIKRTDQFDSGGQIVSIDSTQIEAMAELNMADVLRASPLNAYGSFNERSGSSAQSNATFNLRGLGSQRTLVMMDGTRLPGSPNLGADSLNLNMMPMAAIERVDILADGASAVYGSDAVAGVVNLVTRKRFEGVEIRMRYGDRDQDDGGDQGFSLLAGTVSDRGSVMFAVEYSHRDPIFDADRPYTAPWIVDDGDGRIDAYIDTDGISYYGRTWRIIDSTTGYSERRAAADCPTTDGFTGVMGAGAFGEWDGTLCTFAYAGISAHRAELTKVNSYTWAEYEVSDHANIYFRGLFARNKSFGRYAPPAAQWPNPPADHPHNPFDIEGMLADGTISEDYRLLGYYRWTNIGPRDNYVNDTQWDMMGGIKGEWSDDISYDFYAQYGRYDVSEFGYYYLSYPGLDYVLNNGIDPFSEEGAAAMRAVPTQDNFAKQKKIYGQVQFATGDLWGAGESYLLVGSEYVELDYQNKYDAHSEGGFIGGSAGNSSSGQRDFISLFAEFLMPVTENSELNMAVRYDDYSDFGSATSPSLSYNWHVTDNIALRARWGQGFKAPSLSDLYGPETFSAEDAYDPITGTDRQFDTYYNTNPDLDAEESDSYSLGLNWRFLDSMTIDLAYYYVEVTNVITNPSTQSLLYADSVGQVWDPNGTRVERIGTDVNAVYSYATNGDKLQVSGIDFQWNGIWDTGWGMWSAAIFWSHQLEYKQNAYFNGGFQDTAGFNGQPSDRAQGALTWEMGDFGIDLIVDYVGPHSEEDNVDEQTGVLTTSSTDLDSWTTANLSGRWDAGKFGMFRLGVNNVTDEDPVLDKDGKYDRSHYNLYNSLGRVYFIEYKIGF